MDPNTYTETLESQEVSDENDFGNYQNAEKSGYKFHDLNANGMWDVDEPGLEGWTIEAVQDSVVVASTTTDADGYYMFSLKPGTYTFREVLQTDWIQSFPMDPNTYTETLESQEVSDENDFGNYQNAEKSGYKFHDLNANGMWDVDEPGLEGWTIEAVQDSMVVASTTTDADGYYMFSLKPGTYTFREVLQTDWIQSFPMDPNTYTETLESQDVSDENDFGNYQNAIKSGHKFYDRNLDGIWQEGEEEGLAGWIIFIDDDGIPGYSAGDTQTVTDSEGMYEFILKPGTYTISEYIVEGSGWEQTAPAAGVYTETFISGQISLDNDFGNIYISDETAWGYGAEYAIEFMETPMSLSNWGWTNGPIDKPEEGSLTVGMELWADTGGNYFPDGTQVGTGTITYYSDGSVRVVYNLYNWVMLDDIHVWIGNSPLPMKKAGYTNAPGQFNFNTYSSLAYNTYEVLAPAGSFSGEIYVAAHAVVKYAAETPPDPMYPTE